MYFNYRFGSDEESDRSKLLRYKEMVPYLPTTDPIHILDFGAGQGQLSQYIQKHTKVKVSKYYLCDHRYDKDEALTAIAHANCGSLCHELSISIPPGIRYDIGVICAVLQDCTHADQALSLIRFVTSVSKKTLIVFRNSETGDDPTLFMFDPRYLVGWVDAGFELQMRRLKSDYLADNYIAVLSQTT